MPGVCRRHPVRNGTGALAHARRRRTSTLPRSRGRAPPTAGNTPAARPGGGQLGLGSPRRMSATVHGWRHELHDPTRVPARTQQAGFPDGMSRRSGPRPLPPGGACLSRQTHPALTGRDGPPVPGAAYPLGVAAGTPGRPAATEHGIGLGMGLGSEHAIVSRILTDPIFKRSSERRAASSGPTMDPAAQPSSCSALISSAPT